WRNVCREIVVVVIVGQQRDSKSPDAVWPDYLQPAYQRIPEPAAGIGSARHFGYFVVVAGEYGAAVQLAGVGNGEPAWLGGETRQQRPPCSAPRSPRQTAPRPTGIEQPSRQLKRARQSYARSTQ